MKLRNDLMKKRVPKRNAFLIAAVVRWNLMDEAHTRVEQDRVTVGAPRAFAQKP